MNTLARFTFLLFLLLNAAVGKTQDDNQYHSPADTTLARQWLELSYHKIDSAYYDEAWELAERAQRVYEAKGIRDTIGMADAYFAKGIIHSATGRYHEGLLAYEKAYNFQMSKYSEQSPHQAAMMIFLADAHANLCHEEEREKYLRKGISIQTRLLPERHEDWIHTYQTLSYYYVDYANADSALFYAQLSLDLALEHWGENHLSTAYSCSSIGQALPDPMTREKENNYKRAIAIVQELYGDQHPSLAYFYSLLGSVKNGQQQPRQALAIYQKSLKIQQKKFGKEHLFTAYSYDGIGHAYMNLQMIDTALVYFENALAIKLKALSEMHEDVAWSYHNIGDCLSNLWMKKNKEAMAAHSRALEINKFIFGEGSPRVAYSLGRMGEVHLSMGHLSKALIYFQNALSIVKRIHGEASPLQVFFLNNIAEVYQNMGSSDKQLEYSMMALDLIQRSEHPNPYALAEVNINISAAYSSQFKYDMAGRYWDQASEGMIELFGANNPIVRLFPIAQIAVNPHIKTPLASIKEIEEALSMLKLAYGEDNEVIAILYVVLARMYQTEKNIQKAFEYAEKAANIYERAFGNHGYSYLYSIHNYRAALFLEQNDLYKAKNYLQQSLALFDYTEGGTSAGQVDHPKSLLETLALKGIIHLTEYRQTNDRRFLTLAISNYQFMDELISRVQRDLKDVDSKTNLYDLNYGAYDNYLKALIASTKNGGPTSYLQDGFHLVEKLKYSSLFEEIKNYEAFSFANIPDSLIERESDLKVEISYHEKVKFEESRKGAQADSTMVGRSNVELFKLREAYADLRQLFRKEYPNYHALKYKSNFAGAEDVQRELLTPETALLEYFVGDTTLSIFLLQTDRFEVFQISKDSLFNQWVDDMTRNGIYGYYTAPSAKRTRRLQAQTLKNYTESAYLLYQKLIAPVEEHLKNTEKLILIPDGILGYIPFEALLTEPPAKPSALSTYRYLLERYQISYCYSATLLREMRDKAHRTLPENTILAMAPFYFENPDKLLVDHSDPFRSIIGSNLRDTLVALPASGEEAAAISRLLGGQSLLGSEAGLEQFRKMAGNYRILHLSTHGQADDRVGDYAYLAFSLPDAGGSFDKLYARDLYNLSLNADLVVLSACETGVGRLQRGEGIVSLARAFAYAGAKSMITSLWKVSDNRSSELLIDFYRLLKEGQAKDAALRQAKQSFLERHAKNPELRHPFFWAGFIGIGDMSPVR